MSQVTFVVEPHPRRPDEQVVGIWIDGVRCAAITPGEENERRIRITSAHFKGDRGVYELPTGVGMAPMGSPSLPVPMLQIDFDIRPYTIEDGKLIRL